MSNILPIVPSELLRLALRDLEWIERRPRQYAVDMISWIRNHRGRCYVCLAGAVMVHSLKANSKIYSPMQFGGDSRKLLALDMFRVGNIQDALNLLSKGKGGKEHWVHLGIKVPNVISYNENPALFKEYLRLLADQLEEFGA